MAKKNRRDERRDRRAAPLRETLKAPAPSQRNTFRVYRAQQAIAKELPGVVRNRQAERAERAAKRAAAVSEAPLSADPPKAVPKAARPVRQVQPQKGIAEDSLRLKCPPKDTKPKGGAGSGRSFVPWNKNC